MAQADVRAVYVIRVRNTSRTLGDAIANPRKVSIVKRFNLVSSWALELDATDPVAAQLMQPGFGVQIERTLIRVSTGVRIGTPTVEIAGNMQSFSRTKAGETLTVSGNSDVALLSGVEAWPVTNYPYQGYVTGLANLARYYRLNDTVGSGSAHDFSTNNNNGTPTAITFGGSSGGMDDPTAKSAHFVRANSSKIIASAVTNLPTGDGDWTQSIRFQMNAFPTTGQFMYIMGLGDTSVAFHSCYLICDEFGEFKLEPNGNSQGDIFTPVVGLNTWHTFGARYDHTTHTIDLWFDGVQIGSKVYQTLALSQNCVIGAQYTGSVYQNFASMDANEAIALTRRATDLEMFNMQSTPFSRFNFAAYDVQSSVNAETAMRHYVDANAISAVADPNGTSRVITGLALETNSNRGSTISDQTRFDKLVLKDGSGILQRIAQNGGGLGFELVPNGTNLNFHIYQPTDRSATVRFSDELGNVIDFNYSLAGPDPETGANVIAVGGGGDGVARIFVFRQDATSISAWGRIESFQDARDTLDIPTMQGRGDVALAQSVAQTTFGATLAQSTDAVYGFDFFLGDKVTAIVDAGTFSDYVREVDIDLDGSGGEVVTPRIGTPGADFIQSADSKLRQITSRNLARITALERRK